MTNLRPQAQFGQMIAVYRVSQAVCVAANGDVADLLDDGPLGNGSREG